MIPILIERSEVTVPRRGTQAQRRRLQKEFRKKDPQAAANLERQPWYVDPEGPYGGDDWLTIHYEWIEMGQPNCPIKSSQSFFPIRHAAALQPFTCGPVRRYTEEEFPSCEFSYPLKASFALEMLQMSGLLPGDSVLANDSDLPVCCEEAETA